MKVVQIEWLDSSGTDGWSKGSVESLEPSRCTSVGYLLKETKEFITIYQSKDSLFGSMDHALCVPKFAITKRKVLK